MPKKSLSTAIRDGDVEVVKKLINKRNISRTNKYTTPLHRAVSFDHFELAKLLIEKGANINKTSCDKITPLMAASMQKNTRMVRLLIEKGADTNMCDTNGNTPLHAAAHDGYLDISSLLIEGNADKEVMDYEQETPLCKAVKYGRLELAKYLLEKGTSVNSHRCSVRPIHLAVERRDLEMTKLLLENHADINIGDEDEVTALAYASENGDLEITKFLIDRGADVNKSDMCCGTPLLSAACDGQLEIAKLLVENGAHINWSDKQGYTPLLSAAENGHTEVVKFLLESGVDVDQRKWGLSALYLATRDRRLDTVKLLLHFDASIDECIIDRIKNDMVIPSISELIISVYNRRWTPDIHFCFPTGTREVILALMLLQRREKCLVAYLPNEILMMIIKSVATAEEVGPAKVYEMDFEEGANKQNNDL